MTSNPDHFKHASSESLYPDLSDRLICQISKYEGDYDTEEFSPKDEKFNTIWQQKFGFSSTFLPHILLRDLPHDMVAGINIIPFDKGNHLIINDLDLFYGVNRQNYGCEIRSFELLDKKTLPGDMSLETQGNGVGRKLIRNEIEFASLIGIDRFVINASDIAGAYVWARMGFLLDDDDIPNLQLFSDLKRRIDILEPWLDKDIVADLRHKIANPHEQTLWEIADIDLNVNYLFEKQDTAADLLTMDEMYQNSHEQSGLSEIY